MARTRGSKQSPLAWRWTVLWLVALVVLGLFLRVYFNVDASFDEESGRYLYSGNDPYYHDRVTEHILVEGESKVRDEAINYPHGDPNANPPIHDWTAAMVAGFLHAAGLGVGESVGIALNSMTAIWGALTVIPIYMLGAELFGRRAGVWSAFLMAVSGPHIQRGLWGFADHDAPTMFFIVLAMAFLIKGLRTLDHREYVRDWRHGEARAQGIRSAFVHNQEAMVWSVLAGLALAATALTWKGYPYVLAIMAVAVFLQLLLDHARNRDSTAMFAFYVIPLLLVTLLPLAYYNQFALWGFMDTTIVPGLYVLLGVIVAGLLLVPTRDLPSIIVFPALALAAAIGLAVLLIPGSPLESLGRTIFTGLGYFEQNKLYSTIAEAQRTELGLVAASFGFFTFLIAFWVYFWHVVRRAWKGDEAHMLMAAWGAVALFMAFAASRFVSNAAPVFAVLGGSGVALLVSKLGLQEVRRRYESQHGQGTMARAAGSLTWKGSLGALAVALFIVLPNLWIGVDAAMPAEYERDHELSNERWGAFGINYGISLQGWLEALHNVSARDTCRSDPTGECAPGDLDYQPLEERPAFIAWWDYGHWIVNVGKHPTVADPFQNHFNLAGRFLASESEEEAMRWLTLLILDADWVKNNGYSDRVSAALEEHAADMDRGRPYMNDDSYELILPFTEGEEAFALYEAVTEAADLKVGYMGVDSRMWPRDARNTGIFYAPTFLANKNPDDFLQTTFVGGNLQLRYEQYGMTEDGDSYRLDEPRFVDVNTGREYVVRGNQAFPKGQQIVEGAGVTVQQQFDVTERFENTMYAQAYGGLIKGQQAAGDGLAHWRVIEQAPHDSQARFVALLQYYSGATVSGQVVDETGRGVADAEVTIVDGGGAGHARAQTDANGAFSVLSPFAVNDDLTLVVLKDGAVVARQSEGLRQFTVNEANEGAEQTGLRVEVKNVDLEGIVYEDLDTDGTFNASIDRPLTNATVTIGDTNRGTNATGHYLLENLQPGRQNVSVTAPGYEAAPTVVTLSTEQNVTERDFALRPAAQDVNVTVVHAGQPVADLPVSFSSEEDRWPPTQGSADANGTFGVQLRPETWTMVANHTFPDGTRYFGEMTFSVELGEPRVLEFQVQREEGDSVVVPE